MLHSSFKCCQVSITQSSLYLLLEERANTTAESPGMISFFESLIRRDVDSSSSDDDDDDDTRFVEGYEHLKLKPVQVALGYKQSNFTATITDSHSLGPLVDLREGNCDSIKPSIIPEVNGYHTGGMTW